MLRDNATVHSNRIFTKQAMEKMKKLVNKIPDDADLKLSAKYKSYVVEIVIFYNRLIQSWRKKVSL